MRILQSRQFKVIVPSKTPQGILAVVSLPQECYSPDLPPSPGERILLLEGIQDPGNVGTLIRTASAFDFSGVIVSANSADPYAPKAVAASAGSILSVWIRRTKEYINCATALKTEGYSVVAAGMQGDVDSSLLKKDKIILLLGNEGRGLSYEMLHCADTIFTIPFNSFRVESLNVAAAGAVSMFLVSKGEF